MNVPEFSSPGSPDFLKSKRARSLYPDRSRVASLVLPPALLTPWFLVAVWVIPQSILLAINLRAWDLIAGETSLAERSFAFSIAGLEVLSLATGIGLSAFLWLRKANFSRRWGVVPLLTSSLYLATAFILANFAIPNSVEGWMLPPNTWLLHQFALAMPAALFGGFRLLCPDQVKVHSVGIGRAIVACIALVGGCYLYLFSGMLGSLFQNDGSIPILGITLGTGYIALSTLAAASVLRLCTSLYVAARTSNPWALGMLTATVALFAPLGGLWLNYGIPFPSNFQLPTIYTLAVVNGVVLLLPNFAHPVLHRATWLAQCLLFPFTVYFFAVFLAFLPLAPLGMILFGAGLLIYVPSALFLLHSYRIFDGYRAEIRDGRGVLPLALGLAAILLWPIGYTVQARLDRASLHQALDYLQYPNYSANNRYEGNLGQLRSSLTHLRDFKDGVYMPYLSEYYNWLAFDGLVLPDKKLEDLANTFLGAPLPKTTAPPSFSLTPWENRGRGNRGGMVEQLNGPTGTRPTQLARATSTQVNSVSEGGVTRTNAILQIENPASGATEFRTIIDVPPGVMISGMWLTIGTERVPGRIFEKRAAMWVYQKITEVRPVPRDPAILRYVSPTQAELLVYPVESGTPRTVEVEFLYPDQISPALQIGAAPLDIPASPPQPTLVSAHDGSFIATIPAGSVDAPAFTRQPYLHLLVDTSQKSAFQSPQRLRLALQSAQAAFPDVTETRVTFVNFETRSFDGSNPLKDLIALSDEQLVKASGPVRGGFLPALGIKEILWRHHLALQDKEDAAFHRFPRIVILPGTETDMSEEDYAQLAPFARFLPDQPGYWTLPLSHATPTYTPLHPQNTAPGIQPIHIFQAGNARFAVAAQHSISHISLEPDPTRPTSIEAFNPQTGKFQEITAAISQPTLPAYAAAIAPWSLELGRIYQPYKHQGGDLDQLLKLCRQTGILVPSAAYMVVENSAQWKMLERTEAKTTKSHEALALSEPSAATPEPSTIALLLIGISVIALHLWRKRRAAIPVT